MNTETITPEIEILNYFNQITGHRHRETKDNLSGIKRTLKEGYSFEEIKEVIQCKTLDWKNNEDMSKHLNPVTIFRARNFDKYINQVIEIKNNPKKYAKYFAKINKVPTRGNDFSDLTAMYGD
jgi:uncharacterized phage protein (TIGR02220 family)